MVAVLQGAGSVQEAGGEQAGRLAEQRRACPDRADEWRDCSEAGRCGATGRCGVSPLEWVAAHEVAAREKPFPLSFEPPVSKYPIPAFYLKYVSICFPTATVITSFGWRVCDARKYSAPEMLLQIAEPHVILLPNVTREIE